MQDEIIKGDELCESPVDECVDICRNHQLFITSQFIYDLEFFFYIQSE